MIAPTAWCWLLQPGDVLLFDGYTVHAGASYAKPNTRLFVYLDVPGVVREKTDSTYLGWKEFLGFSECVDIVFPWESY